MRRNRMSRAICSKHINQPLPRGHLRESLAFDRIVAPAETALGCRTVDEIFGVANQLPGCQTLLFQPKMCRSRLGVVPRAIPVEPAVGCRDGRQQVLDLGLS